MPTYEEDNEAYLFNYGVFSNENYQKQNFGQKEHRNANEVMGEWYVELPDGRVQRVRYHVDKHSGFVADVTYEGKASADYKSQPVPDYVPRELPKNEAPYLFNPYG